MGFFTKKIKYIFDNYGLWGLCKELYFCLIATPFVLIILILDPLVKIRLIKLYSWRIGHFGVNTHLMLCYLKKNKERNKYVRFYYADPFNISNKQLYKMWKRAFFILPFRRVCFQIDRLLSITLKEKYLNDPVKQFEYSSGVDDKWGFFCSIQEPFIKFTTMEIKKGAFLLKKLGIREGSKFVCLLVRDSKYLQTHMNNDGSFDSYRDADISNYYEAITLLINRGYYVIRMGKDVHHKLDFSHHLVIDYANHTLRSDFLDIYLAANCDLFISTTTGLDCIPRILNKPLLLTNFFLYDLDCENYDMFVPKLVNDNKNDRFLTFKEMFLEFNSYKKQGGRYEMFKAWKEKQWSVAENNSNDIEIAVNDMINSISKEVNDEENHLEKIFWESFPFDFPASYPASYHERTKIRPSHSFLNKYSSLIT